MNKINQGIILCALKSEAQALMSAFRENFIIKKGPFPTLVASTQTGNISIIQTGLGFQGLQEKKEWILNSFNPRFFINFGLAGAISSHLELGDVVMITQVYDCSSGTTTELLNSPNNPHPASFKLACLEENQRKSIRKNIKCVIGGSVRWAVESESHKVILAQKYSIDIVDLECFFIAELAQNAEIPFYSFKIISDYANENTQKDFFTNKKKILQDGSYSVAQAIRIIMQT